MPRRSPRWIQATSTRPSASVPPCTASRARWRPRSRRCARRSRPTTGTMPAGSGATRAMAQDLERRLLGLPGIGEMKAKSLIAVLGKRFGVRPPGYDDGRADLADPRRRGLGRGPRHLPGRQARPQGRACGPPRTADRPACGRPGPPCAPARPAHRHHDDRPANGSPAADRDRVPQLRRPPVHHRARRAPIGPARGCSTSRRTRISRSTSRAPRRPTSRRRRGSSPTRRNDAPCSPRSSGSGPARTSRR